MLNQNYGPHVPNACTNCRGVVTLVNETSYALNCEYYGMGHFSKFLKEGAFKLQNIFFGGSGCVSGIHPFNLPSMNELIRSTTGTALRNTDDSIVAVVHNWCAQPQDVIVQLSDSYVETIFPVGLSTVYWIRR